MRGLSIVLLLLACLSGTGCAGNNPKLDKVTVAEKSRLLSGELLFGEDSKNIVLPDEDVLGLSEEIINFIDTATYGLKTDKKKLDALLKAMIHVGQPGLTFDDNATFTATETFRYQRANCLSFTTLIVPMVRHLGMKVVFNDVDVPPIWNLQNKDMLILYRHVNAIVTKSDTTREVIDFNMAEYNSRYSQRVIPDQVAEAQYYNNRAMEFLLQDNITDAFRYERKAIELAPKVSFFWVNLGVLYRKLGHPEAAETAFREALAIEPDDLVAISNAERIYRALGQPELAEQFRQRANSFRNKNPYYLYTLAMQAYVQHEYDAAVKNIRAAIRRYGGEHRFYFLQGAIYTALGEQKHADSSFNRALDLTTNQKQQDRYRRKIDKLL